MRPVKAMILAAGRGERMRPLTDTTPKPLLAVGGKPLIVWHLEALARAGVEEVVINHAWLGGQIEDRLGDGSAFGLRIHYSAEGTALETAGGIAKALPLLGEAPFIVLSADIFTHYPLPQLLARAEDLARTSLVAHLVLTHTTRYQLDFNLAGDRVSLEGTPSYTYANLAVIKPELVASVPAGQHAKLGPLFREFAAQGRIGGEVFQGDWVNVGSPEDLRIADIVAASWACEPR